MNPEYRKFFAPLFAFLFLGLMFVFNQITKEQGSKTYETNKTEPNEMDTTKRPETGEIRFDNFNDSQP